MLLCRLLSPGFIHKNAARNIEQHIYIVKLATVVEGYQKAPFSIATTPSCRGGRYSFPWIAPLYLETYLIMLIVKPGGIKYHFLSFWYVST